MGFGETSMSESEREEITMDREFKAIISVEEALGHIMPHFHALEPEEVDIVGCLDRVLANDIYSNMNK